jgi:hypothetical protein
MKLIQTKTRFQCWLLLGLVVVSVLTIFIGLPTKVFAANRCTQEYGYASTIVHPAHLVQTASPLVVVNTSSSSVVAHKTITITGTTTYSLSGTITAGVSAEAGVIFATVKTEFSASVTGTISKTFTKTETDTVDVPVPAHSVRHVEYGRAELVTRGEFELILTNCSVVNEGIVTASFPYENMFLITN